MKPDRMAAYEAPRISEPTRPVVSVTLTWRGNRRGGEAADGAANRSRVQLPQMRPMPEVLTYRGRIFLRRSEDKYTEAITWPVLDELDH